MKITNKTVGYLIWVLISIAFIPISYLCVHYELSNIAFQLLGTIAIISFASCVILLFYSVTQMIDGDIEFEYTIKTPCSRKRKLSAARDDLLIQIAKAKTDIEVDALNRKLELIEKGMGL